MNNEFDFKLKGVLEEYDSIIDKIVRDEVEKEVDNVYFLFLKLAITKNITLKEAYSRYEIRRMQEYDKKCLSRYAPSIAEKLIVKETIMIKVREVPIDIPDKIWNDHVIRLIYRLAKALKVEMAEPIDNKEI